MFIFNYSNLIDPLLRDIREFVPGFAGMNAGNKVLDVCCGTGDYLLGQLNSSQVGTIIVVSKIILKMVA